MGQTAMYTANPGMRGATLQGVSYPVRDQIMVVDDAFVAAARSLGFIPAVEANVAPVEISSPAPAKAEAAPAKGEQPQAQAARK